VKYAVMQTEVPDAYIALIEKEEIHGDIYEGNS
jgi:hypothetical protein